MPVRDRAGRLVASGILTGLIALPLLPLLPGQVAAADDQQTLNRMRAAATAAATDADDRDAGAVAAVARLTAVDASVARAEAALRQAQSQLTAARVVLAGQQRDLAEARAAEAEGRRRVADAQAHVTDARDELRVMLRSGFESGLNSSLDAITTLGDPGDLADRVGLLDHLSGVRHRRIEALSAAEQALELERQRLTAASARATDLVLRSTAQVAVVRSAVRQAAVADTIVRVGRLERVRALAAARTAAAAAHRRAAALAAESDQLAAVLRARAAAQARERAVAAAAAAAAHRAAAPAPVTSAVGGGTLLMPAAGPFSSGFGPRRDPLTGVAGFHPGQDIAAPTGAPILAANSGQVIYAGQEQGYGNFTCIDRGDGLATCYGHQSAILVSVGQHVQAGQLIGRVGSTGWSTGPHLHFEVRIDGTPVDPLPYL